MDQMFLKDQVFVRQTLKNEKKKNMQPQCWLAHMAQQENK